MNRSSQGAVCVTCGVSPTRKGNDLARSIPAAMHAAARHSAVASPAMLARAPQNADPSANEPRAHTVYIAVTRPRTHGGELVWAAMLNVDITTIQAAPPITRATYTTIGTVTKAAISMTVAKTAQPMPTSASIPACARSRPIISPAPTAPIPRQPISSPKPCAPRPNWRWPMIGNRAHNAEPVAL